MVKGVGRVLAKPDYVVIKLDLESKKLEYNESIVAEAEKINALTKALVRLGFEKDCLKTTDFNVSTQYRYEEDEHENSKRIFDGYVVSHELKLFFDFDTDQLSKVLKAISTCPADPTMHVKFTLKDTTAVNEEMLRSATENAKRKAQVLCDAAGVKLGELVDINYSWGEIDFYSPTSMYNDEYELKRFALMSAPVVDFTPDDIDVSDSATFVWEIL